MTNITRKYEYYFINDLLKIFNESFIDFKDNCQRVAQLPKALKTNLNRAKMIQNKWDLKVFSNIFDQNISYISLNEYFHEYAFCIGEFKLFKDVVLDFFENELVTVKEGLNLKVIRTQIEFDWYFSFLFDNFKTKCVALLGVIKTLRNDDASTYSFWKIVAALKQVKNLKQMQESNYEEWNQALKNLVSCWFTFEHDPTFRENDLGVSLAEITEIIGRLKFLYFQFALIHRMWINQIYLALKKDEQAHLGVSQYDHDNFSFKFFETSMSSTSGVDKKLN